MKVLSLEKRNNFKTLPDLINFMITNEYKLEQAELIYVFSNIKKKLSKKYNNLCQNIKYLLNDLKGEKLDEIVELINNKFKIQLQPHISLSSFEYQYSKFSFNCEDKKAEQYLNKLAEKLKEEKSNTKLNGAEKIIDERSETMLNKKQVLNTILSVSVVLSVVLCFMLVSELINLIQLDGRIIYTKSSMYVAYLPKDKLIEHLSKYIIAVVCGVIALIVMIIRFIKKNKFTKCLCNVFLFATIITLFALSIILLSKPYVKFDSYGDIGDFILGEYELLYNMKTLLTLASACFTVILVVLIINDINGHKLNKKNKYCEDIITENIEHIEDTQN